MVAFLEILLVLIVLWLVGCSLWSILFPERRTWPPERRTGFVYRVSAFSGPAINFVLFALCFLGWQTLGAGAALRFGVGVPMFARGAYLSLDGVFRLGKSRTMGNVGTLEASGAYGMSRNPQYTGAMLAYVGLALLCDSAPGLAGALFSCTWFLWLPFVEEPWLRDKLGAPYDHYASKVPRLLSLRSLRQAWPPSGER